MLLTLLHTTLLPVSSSRRRRPSTLLRLLSPLLRRPLLHRELLRSVVVGRLDSARHLCRSYLLPRDDT